MSDPHEPFPDANPAKLSRLQLWRLRNGLGDTQEIINKCVGWVLWLLVGIGFYPAIDTMMEIEGDVAFLAGCVVILWFLAPAICVAIRDRL